MAYSILRLPSEGFCQLTNLKDRVALNIQTGELVEWPYPWDPSHFTFTPDLSNAYYNHPNPTTYLEIARQGKSANSLFEESPQLEQKTSNPSYIVIGERVNKNPAIGYGYDEVYIRKKKFKKKQFKPEKLNQQKEKKKKIYKKELSTQTSISSLTPVESCKCCGRDSTESNIYFEPKWYHHCDFCKDKFKINVDKNIKLCESCSYNYALGFCKTCEQSFGKWEKHWRDKWGIEHDKDCYCWKCMAHSTCWACHSLDHRVWDCPNITWRSPFINDLPCFLCTRPHQGGPNNCSESSLYSEKLKALAIRREDRYIFERSRAETDYYYEHYDGDDDYYAPF